MQDNFYYFVTVIQKKHIYILLCETHCTHLLRLFRAALIPFSRATHVNPSAPPR